MNQQKETHHELHPTASPSGEQAKAVLTRRHLLKLGVGSVAALTLPALVGCETERPQDPPTATPAPQNPPTATPVPEVSEQTSTVTPAQEAVQVAPQTIKVAEDVPVDQELTNPPEIDISAGQVTIAVALNENVAVPVKISKTEIEMRQLNLRNYDVNGSGAKITGPTLRAQPGNRVNILLQNKLLAQGSDECNPSENSKFLNEGMPNCFHGDNVTNLHFHGFHVPPENGIDPGTYGDNVLLKTYPNPEEIFPEAVFSIGLAEVGEARYKFDIPPTQVSGTHWYHAHKHGSTGLQLLNGMAGAFIIGEDYYDKQYPDIEQKVLVLQQIDDKIKILQSDDTIHDIQVPPMLINGQLSPQITMAPGEVQRWRVINATMQASAKIDSIHWQDEDGNRITDPGKRPKVYQIAMDGVPIFNYEDEYPPKLFEEVSILHLASGNRADFLVQAPQNEGLYDLVTSGRGAKEQAIHSGAGDSIPLKDLALLTVEVKGVAKYAVVLPEGLPVIGLNNIGDNLQPVLAKINYDDVAPRQKTVTFNQTGNRGGEGPKFTIDDQPFDPNCVNHYVTLGEDEQWTIINHTNVEHPFHIHVNPFYVTEIYDPNLDPNLKPLLNPEITEEEAKLLRRKTHRWQDTIALPPALLDGDGNLIPGDNGNAQTPGYVVIRHRFLEFTGKYVLHCHILGHEDRGMMQIVEAINPGGDQSNQCS